MVALLEVATAVKMVDEMELMKLDSSMVDLRVVTMEALMVASLVSQVEIM